jgi:hypothetical protein
MSDNVRSYGFIAVLKEPLDDIEEISDKLWREKSLVQVNYEGTLAYIDFNKNQPFSVREDIYGLFICPTKQADTIPFETECIAQGIPVDMSTAKPYNCIWYTGCESPMSCLKKEEFLER